MCYRHRNVSIIAHTLRPVIKYNFFLFISKFNIVCVVVVVVVRRWKILLLYLEFLTGSSSSSNQRSCCCRFFLSCFFLFRFFLAHFCRHWKLLQELFMVALAARDKFYLKKMYRCLKDAVLLLQHDVVCLLKEPAYLSHKKMKKELVSNQSW